MILLLLIVAAATAGLWVGLLLRPKGERFLDDVDGSPPRWSVDHLAHQVAIVAARFEDKRGDEAMRAVRSSRVRFVPHAFLPANPDKPHPGGLPASVSYSGQIVIKDGDGWERRLAWALMQRVRIQLHGHPAQGVLPPAFAAADKVAEEVSSGNVRQSQDGAREVGAVVADR